VTNFRRQILIKTFMLVDLWIIAVSYVAAAVQVWHLTAFRSFAAFFSMRVKLPNILLFLGLFFCWHIIFSVFGLYGSKRLANQRQETVDILKATSMATLVLGLAAAVFKVRMVTLVFMVVFWAISSLFLILCRSLMREILAWVRTQGHNLRYVLIVGTNNRALEFARIIEGRPELGYQLIGFVDGEWTESRKFRTNGKSIVTDLERFSDFLRHHIVDEVAIALPMKSFYSEAARIAAACQEQGVIVRVLASIFDLQKGWVNDRHFDGTAVATFSPALSEGWPMACKRLFDILISSLSLLVLAPIFLVVAILIKFDSTGPVFFIQERVGLNKRRFRIYKFRTMADDAENKQSELESLNEADGPVFKIKNDPRVTRLGKFLRKASVDELPQFLNVLKGDMSLVGPRPLPIRDYQAFDRDSVRRRFSVRPGITCLWQINGRSSLSFKEWMELDLHYVDHWSFWLDMKLLVKTIPAVLKGVGAA
jgi:exopolysaccharide biosynthesis polyprenyl glycosylphosphotransferase